MKVIDLLNKIANGEEVPKKIKYRNYEYEFNKIDKEYQRWFNGLDYGLGEDRRLDILLDEEVEIIEDTPKENKKLSLENTQYALIPSWFRDEEMIKVINSNFEKHKQALKRIVDYINNMK